MIFGTGCLLAVLALIAAGCGNDDDEDGAVVPTVIATTSIWADVAANVACGGLADVTALIPPGGDPHAFQPSLSDRGSMENASLIVANGLGLEEGLEDTIDAVEQAGTPVFRVADHVSIIEYGSAMGHEDHDDHDDHEDDHDDHDDHEDDHDDHETTTTTRITRTSTTTTKITRTTTMRKRATTMRTRTAVKTPMCGSIPFELPMHCPRSARLWPPKQALMPRP